MKLLLDTHALLWFLRGDQNLSVRAKEAIENPANEKWVSLVSCWEIAIKAALGKLALAGQESWATFLDRELRRNNIQLQPVEFAHVMAVESLPRLHGDPFDRLLLVQAKQEGMKLVSADEQFVVYGVERLW